MVRPSYVALPFEASGLAPVKRKACLGAMVAKKRRANWALAAQPLGLEHVGDIIAGRLDKLMNQAQDADEVREWARRENVRVGLGMLSKL